jgi:hypothetical protein
MLIRLYYSGNPERIFCPGSSYSCGIFCYLKRIATTQESCKRSTFLKMIVWKLRDYFYSCNFPSKMCRIIDYWITLLGIIDG